MENGQSFVARGVLALDVPNFAAIKDQALTSACVLIGNLNWQLKLCKGNGNANNQSEKQHYSLYANCNEMCTEHFWFCSAKFKFYSKQDDGGQEQMSMISSTDPLNAFYGNSQLLIGSINPSKAHPILLIVEVQIMQEQPKMFALDTNIQVRMANGATGSVAVNKQGLAVISTYFQNFFAQPQLWTELVIREDDNPTFDIDTFRLMIYGSLSLSWMVPELLELFKEGSRILDILKLAYKYDIRPLIKYCENQLILDPKTYPPNSEMLQLAEGMDLAHLRNHCLAKLNAVESMENKAAGCSGDAINSGQENSVTEKLDIILKEKETEMTLEQTAGGGISPIRVKIPCIRKLIANCSKNRKSKKGPNRKSKKPQGRFKAEHKKILEDEYAKDKYADVHRLNEIIAKTGLPKERIKNWFNNQRSKEKKQGEEHEEEDAGPTSSSNRQESSSAENKRIGAGRLYEARKSAHQEEDASLNSSSRQKSSSANKIGIGAGRLYEARKSACHQQKRERQSLEKRFECKFCGKCSRQKINLKQHIRVRHHQTENLEEYVIINKRGRKGVKKHSVAVNVKKSKCRENLSAEQKQILDDEFATDKYPNGQKLRQIITKTGLPTIRIKNWFNNQRYTVKKQSIHQQEEGMSSGSEVIDRQQSSSPYGSAASTEHLAAEEGKTSSQQNHPLDCLLVQSTNNEETAMNHADEVSNYSDKSVSVSEPDLAIKDEHADQGENYDIKCK